METQCNNVGCNGLPEVEMEWDAPFTMLSSFSESTKVVKYCKPCALQIERMRNDSRAEFTIL